jgi:hypothetical protein
MHLKLVVDASPLRAIQLEIFIADLTGRRWPK